MDVQYFLYALLIIFVLVLLLYVAEYLYFFFKQTYTTFTTSPDTVEPDIEITTGKLFGRVGKYPFRIDFLHGDIALNIFYSDPPIVYHVKDIDQAIAYLETFAIDEETT